VRVFISHSSRDRWIARQIDFGVRRNRGVATFLDEKDLQGGDAISETVRAELRRCDELVVLLSSASLTSDWVKAEMGAAWGLRKRIVVLLDKLQVRDIPQVFTDYKAFDLNDAERYFQEVRSRAARTRRSAKTRKKP
jgi:hypothetical protein